MKKLFILIVILLSIITSLGLHMLIWRVKFFLGAFHGVHL